MFTHILLAYDGSDHARKAAQLAGNMAREQQPKAMVRLVVAVEPIQADVGEPNFSRTVSERAMRGEKLIEEARQLLGAGLEIHNDLLFGPAAEEIVNAAEIRKCDLIIMGSRGVGGLRGLLLGSHAQKVIAHAGCPVLIVR
jgi:nucleotide-binding universal stress UspA family protein